MDAPGLPPGFVGAYSSPPSFHDYRIVVASVLSPDPLVRIAPRPRYHYTSVLLHSCPLSASRTATPFPVAWSHYTVPLRYGSHTLHTMNSLKRSLLSGLRSHFYFSLLLPHQHSCRSSLIVRVKRQQAIVDKHYNRTNPLLCASPRSRVDIVPLVCTSIIICAVSRVCLVAVLRFSRLPSGLVQSAVLIGLD